MVKKILVLFVFVSFCFAKGFIVLNPSCVEIFYMLNAGDKISAIATTASSDIWPKEDVAKLPSVGNYVKPNLEKIIELEPEHVITSFHSTEIIDDLKRFNIKYTEIEAKRLDDIYENIRTISELIDKKSDGEKLINELKQKLERLNFEKTKGKKAIFFYTGANLISFGKDSMVDDIFNLMKIKNLARNLEGKTPIVSGEFLVEQNPDYILFVGKNVDNLIKQNPLLKHTTAYKNNKIIPVNSASLLRGTPRIVFEIENLYKQLIK